MMMMMMMIIITIIIISCFRMFEHLCDAFIVASGENEKYRVLSFKVESVLKKKCSNLLLATLTDRIISPVNAIHEDTSSLEVLGIAIYLTPYCKVATGSFSIESFT